MIFSVVDYKTIFHLSGPDFQNLGGLITREQSNRLHHGLDSL